MSTLSQLGKFASAPFLSKAATPPGLHGPSLDAIKSDFAARHCLADLLSVQKLVLFLKDCARVFQSTPSQHDPKGIWAAMHQLLTGVAMAIQPLALDAAGSACWTHGKLQCNMVKDAPANVK